MSSSCSIPRVLAAPPVALSRAPRAPCTCPHLRTCPHPTPHTPHPKPEPKPEPKPKSKPEPKPKPTPNPNPHPHPHPHPASLQNFGIEAFVGPKKKYSTDANLAGLSHEAEDLESMQTPMLIVEPEMSTWPQSAPDKVEEVELTFKAGRCVAMNGKPVTPLQAIQEANAIGGRNGLGLSHALENRIIGTKSRGVYEAPGMELLGKALEFVYQTVLDRRAATLFWQMSKLVSDQIYDGRYFDPATRAAILAIKELTAGANGTVKVGAYKGNVFFLSLTGADKSIYNEEDASMEASNGLNPVSSQGFAEIQSVEARSLAKGAQIPGDLFPGGK